MALIGYLNKMTEDVYLNLIFNDRISKLLYYSKNLDDDIDELDSVKNPVNTLKKKIFKNRRIEALQKEADVAMTVSVYSRNAWKDNGVKYDMSLENAIEIGICCHIDIDEMGNGSRVYALIDETIKQLSGNNIDGLGKIHFDSMYKTKDLDIEHIGYQLIFTIFNLKTEV